MHTYYVEKEKKYRKKGKANQQLKRNDLKQKQESNAGINNNTNYKP